MTPEDWESDTVVAIDGDSDGGGLSEGPGCCPC